MAKNKQSNVQKIADLARLQISPKEESHLQKKFDAVLSYIDILTEIEANEEDLLFKNEALQSIYRSDLKEEVDIKPEKFSPYTEDSFFKTPRVIE